MVEWFEWLIGACNWLVQAIVRYTISISSLPVGYGDISQPSWMWGLLVEALMLCMVELLFKTTYIMWYRAYVKVHLLWCDLLNTLKCVVQESWLVDYMYLDYFIDRGCKAMCLCFVRPWHNRVNVLGKWGKGLDIFMLVTDFESC